MKRTKEPVKSIPKAKESKKPVIEKQQNNIGFLEKFMSKYSLLFLISAIFIVGFFAFYNYFLLNNLFFFKGIGSDSINQDLPAIIHDYEYLGNNIFEKWSFFQGMGNVYYKSIPVEPLGFISYLYNLAGNSLFGDEFGIYSRFIGLFIFNFLLSGIIFFYYLRTISVNKYFSVAGALILAFSGYMVVGSSWGFSGHIFRAVFLLFAFEQLFVKNRWYFFPIAIIYASGNIFILYIYSLFLLTYSLFRYFSNPENKIKGYIILASKMILFGAIGLVLNIVNIWRNFELMFFSPRVVGNSSFSDELTSGNIGVDYTSHNATAILRFFSSDILGTGTHFKGWYNYFEAPAFYIGLFAILVFSQIFVLAKRREAILFGIFAAFWFLPIFFPQMRYAILLYTGDYYRFGFDFFIPFIILFAAIFSVNKIAQGAKPNLFVLGGTFVFLMVLVYYPYNSIPKDIIDSSIRKFITLFLIIYTGIIFLFSRKEYANTAKILFILLIIFELSFLSYKSYDNRLPLTKNEFDKNMAGYNDGTIKAVEYIKQNDRSEFFRTTKDYQSGVAMHGSLNDAMAQGYYGTAQYSSFTQINYVRFLEETGIIPKGDEASTRWITGLRNYPLLLSFANVKYQLSKSENPEFTRFGFNLVNKTGDISILKNNYYLPFGYTYNKYINFDDFEHLKIYKITQISIQNITLELQRLVPQNKVNELIQSVQPIVNKEFDSDSSFYAALKNVLLPEDFQERKFTFIRHSTQNFRNQVALLTCFVNEEGENFIDTSDLMKLNIKDTSVFVDAQYFNFDIYQKLINELKTDTFVFETFSQSRITGNIKISKPEMVFFTIPYDKSWKIKVNGKEEDLKRVNIGFSGIKLNKGNYKIELYYEPDFLKPSIIITIISNLIFWGFLVFYLIRKRRKIKS